MKNKRIANQNRTRNKLTKIKDAIIQQWEMKHWGGDFIAWKSKKWQQLSLQKGIELSEVKGNFSGEMSCYVYRYRAKTSVQDLPLLSPSWRFRKSLPCQRRNSCPEVRRMGVVKFFHMISGEVELYPSILYLWPPYSTLGIKIALVEFVKSTIKSVRPQPQFDHRSFDTLQDTWPWRWTSLTASIWPPTSTKNVPKLLPLAPKHTGFEFNFRQGRSAIKIENTGKILKTHVILWFQLDKVRIEALVVSQESTTPRNRSKKVVLPNTWRKFSRWLPKPLCACHIS